MSKETELIIPIEQALWPKGVVRTLSGVLRNLGDKHGNLVIVAQPTKGHIMVKGPADKVEEAKPGLRAIIEEHFPDADCPEELMEGGAAQAMDVEEPVPEAPAPAKAAAPATPSAPAPAPAPAAKAPAKAPAAAKAKAAEPLAEKVVITGPCHARKSRTSAYASPDLLWQCMSKSSCFMRTGAVDNRRFSAEPGNLMSLHLFKYSGLASAEALDVRPKKVGKKESIELVQSLAKAKRRPGSVLVATGLSKCARKGGARLDREVLGCSYRPALYKLARLKYLKVRLSFKKPKPRKSVRLAKKGGV